MLWFIHPVQMSSHEYGWVCVTNTYGFGNGSNSAISHGFIHTDECVSLNILRNNLLSAYIRTFLLLHTKPDFSVV